MSWCKVISLPSLLKRICEKYLYRSKSLINGGATCPWLELKEPSVSLQSCTSQTKSTHTTYVITSTFLIENICHDSLPQERRKLHYQLAMLQEPLPLKLYKQRIQLFSLPLPQPTQHSFSCLCESFANIFSARSTARDPLAEFSHHQELHCWASYL